MPIPDDIQAALDNLQSALDIHAGLLNARLNDITALQESLAILRRTVPPVGTILLFATTAPPVSYLPCDGRVVRRTEYPELFAAIGAT